MHFLKPGLILLTFAFTFSLTPVFAEDTMADKLVFQKKAETEMDVLGNGLVKTKQDIKAAQKSNRKYMKKLESKLHDEFGLAQKELTNLKSASESDWTQIRYRMNEHLTSLHKTYDEFKSLAR